MYIFFARESLRRQPSALEAYLDAKGYVATNLSLASCIVFENIDDISKLVNSPSLDTHLPKVLIRTEPSVVSPKSYSHKYLASFDLVLTMGTGVSINEEPLGWPQDFGQQNSLSLPELANRFDKPVMVASDKISFVAGELYSLRRQALFSIPEIVLFGFAWGNRIHVKLLRLIKELLIALMARVQLSPLAARYFFRRPKSYAGQVENKREAISAYKYSVVIENEAGYVSEKLFDALFAGCIPIYVGPSLREFDFPAGLVIEVEASISAIKEGLTRARSTDIKKWNELRIEFLQSPTTSLRWKSENVYDDIARRLLRISEHQSGSDGHEVNR